MPFEVLDILDHETILIKPRWIWWNQMGNQVQIFGCCHNKEFPEFSVYRLRLLLLSKHIELKNPKEINQDKLNCSVFLNGIDIAEYFPKIRK